MCGWLLVMHTLCKPVFSMHIQCMCRKITRGINMTEIGLKYVKSHTISSGRRHFMVCEVTWLLCIKRWVISSQWETHLQKHSYFPRGSEWERRNLQKHFILKGSHQRDLCSPVCSPVCSCNSSHYVCSPCCYAFLKHSLWLESVRARGKRVFQLNNC